MTDLISREALLEVISDKWAEYTLNSIISLITNAPAIEQDKRVYSFAWALIMETAASFEVASYSISDADAKKSAEGAIKYARDTANKYYTTPQQPQEQGEAVAKVLFRQDEDGLEPISFYSNDEYPKEEELKDRFVMMDVYLSPQQPQEQGELVKKAVADALEELERALCLIGVVGNVDGHDVIRRDSVINVARQRIKRTPKEGE